MGAQNFEQVWVRRAALPSDEGLGSSIKSDSVGKVVVGNTSEEDGLVQDLIQEADSSEPTSRRLRQRASHPSSRSSSTITPSAVTESIAPRPSRPTLRHPPLSRSARNKLKEHIISPILQEARFENLHPFVTALDSKTNKSIRCLRDLEQSLIFQPLTFAISRHLYRAFGEFTIQLVVDAYQHLSESEQRRAADRPYDNGYFLDLVQQVHRLASHIGSSGRAQQAGTAEEDDEMAYSIDDEVTLEGGLGETGNQAELVRWKNGNGFSLRTGLPYEPTPGIKRQSSGALDEDVARSMARRKKGYIPEYVEMKCSDPTCDKVFTRKCDLAKHEKTHSRPFKCPEEGCKYHKLGLPTEKERERHYNDKHSKDPQFYKCDFCEFRTKRESNCKQHMEKKHGWHYERAKGKDKAPAGSTKMTPAQTPQTPSIDFSASPAISTSHHSNWDDASSIAGSIGGSIAGSAALTPYEQPLSNFDSFHPAPVSYSNPIFPRTTPAMSYNQMSDDFDFNAIPPNQNYQPAQAYVSPITTRLKLKEIAGPSGHTFDKTSMMGQDMEFPSGDFSLFGGDSSNAFSNPAAASATLFPGGPEAFATLDNDPMFSEAFNDGDLFDWDMTN